MIGSGLGGIPYLDQMAKFLLCRPDMAVFNGRHACQQTIRGKPGLYETLHKTRRRNLQRFVVSTMPIKNFARNFAMKKIKIIAAVLATLDRDSNR